MTREIPSGRTRHSKSSKGMIKVRIFLMGSLRGIDICPMFRSRFEAHANPMVNLSKFSMIDIGYSFCSI